MLVTGCAYYRRFYSRYRMLREMIAGGEFGRIVMVRMVYCSWFDPLPDDPKFWRVRNGLSGGGPLSDMGTHMFDVLIGLFGMPSAVSAMTATLDRDWDVEDSSAVLMRLSNGALGTFNIHWNSKTWRHIFEVTGTEARVLWEPVRRRPGGQNGRPRNPVHRSSRSRKRPSTACGGFRRSRTGGTPGDGHLHRGGQNQPVSRCRVPFGSRASGNRTVTAGSFVAAPLNIFQPHIREYFERHPVGVRPRRSHRRQVELRRPDSGSFRFRCPIHLLRPNGPRRLGDDLQGHGQGSHRLVLAVSGTGADPRTSGGNQPHLGGDGPTPSSTTPNSDNGRYTTAPNAKLTALEQYLRTRAWTEDDEIFSLKKFLTYYTPYDRKSIRPSTWDLREQISPAQPLHALFRPSDPGGGQHRGAADGAGEDGEPAAGPGTLSRNRR